MTAIWETIEEAFADAVKEGVELEADKAGVQGRICTMDELADAGARNGRARAEAMGKQFNEDEWRVFAEAYVAAHFTRREGEAHEYEPPRGLLQ